MQPLKGDTLLPKGLYDAVAVCFARLEDVGCRRTIEGVTREMEGVKAR